MKVLMLSTDASILREGTEARRRMMEYAGLFEQLRLVVLTTRNIQYPIPNTQQKEQLFLYSTNSRNKLAALFEAYKIGKRILRDNKVLDPGFRRDDRVTDDWAITSQDPFELGLVGHLLKKKFEVPLQLQVHTDFLSPYFWRESWKNKIRVMLAKWLLPRAEGIRVVSERIKNSLVSSMKYRVSGIEILPILVDTEKIKNAPIRTDLHQKYPQFDFIILMASRISPEKNIGLAIRAMGEVVKDYPKTGLVIVGALTKLSTLRGDPTAQAPQDDSLSNASRMEDNVVFEPWTDDLASYYKTADAFLLTSNYEGYGRTVVEAMAAGLPVIMTEVGVAGELVKNGGNGLIFPVGDWRAGAENLKKIIAHNTLTPTVELPKKEELLAGLKTSIEKLGG